MTPTTTLYRPVGQAEYDLIVAADHRKFPARLSWQPIFYPVLSEAYAIMIARDWNTKDEASGCVGYVLKFEVVTEYLTRYPIQLAGGRELQEYWIPAAELEPFNQQIVGRIEMIHCFVSDVVP